MLPAAKGSVGDGNINASNRVAQSLLCVQRFEKLKAVRPDPSIACRTRIPPTPHTGKAPYSLERTLLTSGILDRAMQSLAQDGKLLEPPELDVKYAAADWPYANRPDSPLTLPNE